MTGPVDLLLALEACEGAPADLATDDVLAMAARQFRVDPDELRCRWIQKILACRAARAALGRRVDHAAHEEQQ